MQYSDGTKQLHFKQCLFLPMYYKGDLYNGKRQGHGVMRYYADYGDGQEHFLGYYEGNWNNDVRQGQGIYFNQSGETLKDGLWDDDDFISGFIKEFYDHDKPLYFGHYENSNYHGEGILFHSNGSIAYNGMFSDGKKHGVGVEYNQLSMEIRRGIWTNDSFVDGTTTLYYNDNLVFYQGSVNEKDVPHGKGTKFSPNGVKKYDGLFHNGQQEGFGTSFDSNGDKIFEGNFHSGSRYGHGIEFKKGKKVFEGEFHNNIKHGFGTSFNDLENEISRGNWEYGRLQDGTFTDYYSTGVISYHGGKKNDQFHGNGTSYSEEGLVQYTGEYKKGKRHGTGTLFRQGILQYIGDFANDKIHGDGVLFYETSVPCYEGKFVRNDIHGKGKLYSSNSVLQKEGFFKRGLLCGQGIVYEDDGETIKQKGKFIQDNFVDEHAFSIRKFLETNNSDFVKKVPKDYLKKYIQETYSVRVPSNKNKQHFLTVLRESSMKSKKIEKMEETEIEEDLFGNPIETPCMGDDGCIYDLTSMNYLFEKNENGDYKNIPYHYNHANERVPNYPVMTSGKRLSSFTIIVDEN